MMSTEKKRLCAVILAAGKGTRMKSGLAKVLHLVCGRPMLAYSIDLARSIGVEKIVIVVGHQADLVRESFKGQGVVFVEQREQLGTGHAVLQARDEFRDFGGTVLILCGDVPLLSPATVGSLYERHISDGSTVTVLTTILENPTGYGRLVKSIQERKILKIVEEKDATPEERKIREINTGIYCVDSAFLYEAVAEIRNENVQREYYLTDIIEIASNKGCAIGSFVAENFQEVMGINTVDDLSRASMMISGMQSENR